MSWKSAATFLALSFFGVGSLWALVYYFRKQNEKDEYLEVRIPKDSVGVVIGRGGNTIKEIEAMSETKLHLKDDNTTSDYKICLIRGTPEAAQYAESLIHEVIVSQPLIETYEMVVPSNTCGRIIGKNGDNIRLICRNSNAKITVENRLVLPTPLERKIIIKGTAEEIAIAKKLLEEKVEEELEFRSQIQAQVSNRTPRNKTKCLLPAKDESGEIVHERHKEKFFPTGSNGMLEVYVSAVESPDRFWLQVMGPSTVELDRLIEKMTEYYSKEENKRYHVLEEVKPGQIVASPFSFDDKWYRAEVLDVRGEHKSNNSEVLLYYVDYGDTSSLKSNEVFELRTDFLRLKFQAIECMLAKVKPRDDEWTDEAIDLLEDLTHVALWKSLMAKIHNHKGEPARVKREGSPVPSVELFDTHGDRTINVGEELVAKGVALWDEETETLNKSSNPVEQQNGERENEETV